MKVVLIFAFILLSIPASAQADVKVFFDQTPDGYIVYADNLEPCPVSISFDFKLVNLTSSEGNTKSFIIPPNSKKNKITELQIKYKLKSYKFDYTTVTSYGDPNSSKYDAGFQYHLPFKKGGSYRVLQGYNGTYTHQGLNAIDFDMPVGTEIHAARKGIVVDVVQENDKACTDEGCEAFNNFVLIYHEDGSFANYAHIKKDGANVKKGDSITVGQLIAYSGNVGRSSGPHLHFEVYLPRVETRKTLKTNFLTGDGDDYSVLMERQLYTRQYD